MFSCDYCGKELKSKGGKTMHERSCVQKNTEKDVDFEQLSEDVAVIDNEPKVVQLDVLGVGGHYPDGQDNNYYEGHPRREVKLRGLLSRTRDEAERSKLMRMIIGMRNEAK